MNDLEEWLAGRLAKAPRLPEGIGRFVCRIMPWVLIVFGILGLLGWLSAVGIFGFASILDAGDDWMLGTVPSVFAFAFILLLAPIAQGMEIAGGCLMLRRRRQGWQIAFYSVLLSFVFHLGCNITGVLWDLLFVYLLFQIRPFYSV